MRRMMVAALSVGLCASALATVELKDGILTFDVASGTETYSDGIAGVTQIVKTGAGKGYLKLGANAASGFTGKVTIKEGTMGADDLMNWGSPSALEIQSGGALDLTAVTGHSNNPTNLKKTPVTVGGSGVNGNGAILLSAANSSGNQYEQLFASVTLSADTVFSSANRWTITGKFDFAGHTLTHVGNSMFSFEAVPTVVGPGRIVNKAGTFNLGGDTGMDNAGTGEIVLEGGTFQFWNQAKNVTWPVIVNKGSTITAGYGKDTKNTFTAPFVHTNGTLTLQANAGAAVTLKDTSLTTTDEGFPDGSSSVKGPYLYFAGQGAVVLNNVAVTNSLTKTKSECIDIRAAAFEWSAPGKCSVLSRVGCPSTNAWIHDAGHIDILRGKQWYVEDGTRGTKLPPRLTVERTEVIGPHSPTYGLCQTIMLANSGVNFQGQLVIGEGAVWTNGLRFGYQGAGTVYQRGGELGWIGGDAFGNKDLSSGTFFLSGGHCARFADHRFGACGEGFHRQTGGFFEHVYGSSVYLGFFGYAEMVVAGGTYRSNKQHNILMPAWEEFGTSYNQIIQHHPEVQFTVSGKDTLFDNGNYGCFYYMCATQACQAVININDGGIFRVKRVGRSATSTDSKADAKVYVNLNGGVLRFALANIYDVRNSDLYNPDAVTLYEKGVVLDTTDMAEEDMDRTHPGTFMRDFIYFNWPVKAATGKGVTAIALPTDAKFLAETFAGPTHVKIVDPTGEGYGANAILDWDPETSQVKGIIITAHGCNYSPTTYATLDSAVGYTNTYACAVTLADNAKDGGFIKRGPFDVHLNKPNVIAGGVRVEQGKLLLAHNSAVPSGNALTLAGGGFGGSWKGFSFSTSTLSGYGDITNLALTVTQGLSFSAADLLAGRKMTFRTDTSVVLNAGTTATLTGYEDLSEADKNAFEAAGRFTLAKFSSTYKGAIPTGVGLPEGWRVQLTAGGTELVAAKRRGFTLLIK